MRTDRSKEGRSGRASRVKGRRGEQAVATILRQAFPAIADLIRRGWQSRVGCDDPDVCGLPGFWIECKTGRQPNMRAAYKQAVLAAKGRAFPIAVVQDDYAKDRMVVIGFQDFLRILRAAYGHTEPLAFAIQTEMFGDNQSDNQSDKVAE